MKFWEWVSQQFHQAREEDEQHKDCTFNAAWKCWSSCIITIQRVVNSMHIRDQQWIDFSLIISTHEILRMSESTVLKFNYSDSFVLSTTLIYKYRLQWVWVQSWHQTHTRHIRNMFDSYAYLFRFINLEKYL